MAHAETPLSAAFPDHDTQTDSLVSVPLTDSVLNSPTDSTTPRQNGHDERDDEVGLRCR